MLISAPSLCARVFTPRHTPPPLPTKKDDRVSGRKVGHDGGGSGSYPRPFLHVRTGDSVTTPRS